MSKSWWIPRRFSSQVASSSTDQLEMGQACPLKRERRLPVLVAAGVIVGIVSVTLAYSYQYVEYYDYALLKQRSTGHVDRSVVYINTRILHGPDYELETYKATSHHVRLNNLAIVTLDRVGIEISVSFQYYLRKEDVGTLHSQHHHAYPKVIIDRATDALKAKVPSFTVREFIDTRQKIEEGMFAVIRERVEGTCCYTSCLEKGTCLPDCTPPWNCSISEKGVFVEVRYFQLLGVSIHQDIAERYLTTLTLQEEAEKSQLEQEAAVIRIQTDAMVEDIRNEAQQIRLTSEADSKLIETEAEANKTAIIESARRTGLLGLYDRLNIRDEKHRNTFDYLRTLRHEEDVHLTVDFQQRIAGSWVQN